MRHDKASTETDGLVVDHEVLDSQQQPPLLSSRARRAVAAVVAVAAVAAVALTTGSRGDPKPVACRHHRAASWCGTPTRTLTDRRLASLVHGYCPKLRGLTPAQIVPQPLSLLRLTPPGAYTAMVTDAPEGRIETAVLGQPGRLALVLHPVSQGTEWALQVVCHDDQLPVLVMDDDQLTSTLQAATGAASFDLREPARAAATAVRVDVGSYVTLGIFRCSTGPPALALTAAARFTCRLRLFTDYGGGEYRALYVVHSRPPYLRLKRGWTARGGADG